jgi:ParB family chromosome partitioning protein
MKSISFVDPFRCRMWDLHDRLESDLTEENCKEEIESFQTHGQLLPVLGRPLRGDPAHDIELIFGARRLFIARRLNKPLAVELCAIPDREALVAMDVENRQRRDISPYERGRGYARWLRSGHFDSQEDVARALNVSAAQVSRMLKLARLPSVVVSAFRSTSDICERWGLDLIKLWEDPRRQRSLARQAREIAAMSPRPVARETYRKLVTSPVQGRRPKDRRRDEVVFDACGAPLFRIRRQAKAIVFLIPADKLSTSCLHRLRSVLADILRDAVPRGRENDAKFSRTLPQLGTVRLHVD